VCPGRCGRRAASRTARGRRDYEQNLATDGASSTTWVAYTSLITGHEGVYAQVVSGAKPGAPQLMPGSRVASEVLVPEQRVGITGRGKGHAGVYVTYEHGWPRATALDVEKLGSAKPLQLASFGSSGAQLAGDTIAADPKGRLWVAWITGQGSAPGLFVRLANLAGPKYGPVKKVPLPAGTTTVWKVYVNAQASKLDVLALVTQHGDSKQTAYWHAQVAQP
jgi:hypothetical protein